jgi:transcriptional regulator with XRE-family HTH domain
MEDVECLGMGQELDRERMRQLRVGAKLSQGEAAAAADISGGASYWSDIENGRRSNVTVEMLGKIAKALGCDARELITPVKTKTKSKK